MSERLVAVEEGLAQTESNCQREKLNSCKVSHIHSIVIVNTFIFNYSLIFFFRFSSPMKEHFGDLHLVSSLLFFLGMLLGVSVCVCVYVGV